MALFEGCQIVLDLTTAVGFKDKTRIRNAVTSNGGIVSFIVTKKSTHVICNDSEKADFSYKCRMAVKYGIPVVSIDWIMSSVETGILQNTDRFLMVGKSKSEGLREGKISASRFQRKDKKKTVKPFINVGSIKVWKSNDKNCPSFTKDFQIAKFALFKSKNSQNKEKKAGKRFAILEVHVDEMFRADNSVCFSKYRVSYHSRTLADVEKGEPGVMMYRFCNSVDETLAVYNHLYKEQQQLGMVLMPELFSRHIGTEKFKQMMGELGVQLGSMTEDVGHLVEHIWHEANDEIDEILTSDISTIKEEQVEKAEAILKQIKSALDSDDQSKISKLMNDFYAALPHNTQYRVMTPTKAWLSRKQDICQLVRDMISVNEATDYCRTASTPAKYRALRCGIDYLDSSSTEFHNVKQLIDNSLTRDTTVRIEGVFAVNRPVESGNFTQDIDNKRLLFHASKVNNIVGILSRGLLMPRVVVDDHGGSRSDPGMLGAGIYFASAASTSIGYSSPSKRRGTRFMLVSEVALGNCLEMFNKDLTLTSAPEGYQSIHGVKASADKPSAFKDDEYVIYSPCQQRLKYLIEFTTDEDTVKEMIEDASSIDLNTVSENEDGEEIDLNDVKDIVDPMSKVKAGLVSNGDAPVNLKSVHVRAKLMDLASEVIVLQEYENNSKLPLEAKYVFPLGDMSAVCGFEAFINGKHIVGEVKEKETAHKEYKKAISEGHGAYLMDQDEETPDVFTVSVGNLPPGASVLIKITYVAELQVEGEMISFRLPGSVAPWKKDSLKKTTQHETDTVEVQQGETTVQVSIEMPFDIRSIECPTQAIKVKRTLTKATVEMLPGESIADGFQLLIGLAEIHVPRMWVERKTGNQDHQACMLTFYPEFEACECNDVNVILLLDLSNSMKGEAIISAKKILLLTLQHMPSTWNFNVVVFGTAWKELFPICLPKTVTNMKLASDFVMNLSASMGNTEVVRPLHTFYLMKPESSVQNILLVSDGHMNNSDTMLGNAMKNSQHTRVFTMGVSATADRHLLRALARVGAGSFEFFDAKVKSKWEGKVKSQLNKAAQPGLTSVQVDWEQYGADVPSPVQAPRQITALFNGSRSVIYGYVPNCTMATLRANIAGDEVSTMVSTSDLSITDGNILHRLTARAIISDWEDGVLSPDRTDHEILKMNTKDYIIELSKEYSIVTQFTSFVAIEKRDEDEEKKAVDAPAMSELVEREDVDQLKYMGFEEEKKVEVDYDRAVDDVLTNIRLNFDSAEKQIAFLKEGIQLAKEIPDNTLRTEKLNLLEKAFDQWELDEKLDYEQTFGMERISAPARQKRIQVLVRTLTGRTLRIYVESHQTVADIMDVLREREGLEPDQQRLIFSGRELMRHMTIQDCNITNRSVLHLVLRLRGGHEFAEPRKDYTFVTCPIGARVLSRSFRSRPVVMTGMMESTLEGERSAGSAMSESDFKECKEVSKGKGGYLDWSAKFTAPSVGKRELKYERGNVADFESEDDGDEMGMGLFDDMSVDTIYGARSSFDEEEVWDDDELETEREDLIAAESEVNVVAADTSKSVKHLAEQASVNMSTDVREKILLPILKSPRAYKRADVGVEISDAICFPDEEEVWDDDELETELEDLIASEDEVNVAAAAQQSDYRPGKKIEKFKKMKKKVVANDDFKSQQTVEEAREVKIAELENSLQSRQPIMRDLSCLVENSMFDDNAVAPNSAPSLPPLPPRLPFGITKPRSASNILLAGSQSEKFHISKENTRAGLLSDIRSARGLRAASIDKDLDREAVMRPATKINVVQNSAAPASQVLFGASFTKPPPMRLGAPHPLPPPKFGFSGKQPPPVMDGAPPPPPPPMGFGGEQPPPVMGGASPPPPPLMFGVPPPLRGKPIAMGVPQMAMVGQSLSPLSMDGVDREPPPSQTSIARGASPQRKYMYTPRTAKQSRPPADGPPPTLSIGGDAVQPPPYSIPIVTQLSQQARPRPCAPPPPQPLMSSDAPPPPPMGFGGEQPPPEMGGASPPPPSLMFGVPPHKTSWCALAPRPPPSGAVPEQFIIGTKQASPSPQPPLEVIQLGVRKDRRGKPPSLGLPRSSSISTGSHFEQKSGDPRISCNEHYSLALSTAESTRSGVSWRKEGSQKLTAFVEQQPKETITMVPTLPDYGIGLKIPLIIRPGSKGMALSKLVAVIEMQNTQHGFWDMDEKQQLQLILDVDFSLCKSVLERAGLNSLGMKCAEETIRMVSTTIVLLCIVKALVPHLFPLDCKVTHKTMVDQFLKIASENVESSGAVRSQVSAALYAAFDYCLAVSKRYPLVFSSLELGSNWLEFVAKCLNLHVDDSSPKQQELFHSPQKQLVTAL